MLRLVHFNAQLLKYKDRIIFEHLTAGKIDIAVMTKTWLKDDDSIWLQGLEINKGCYRTYISNRSMKIGGGLAVITNKIFDVKLISESERQNFHVIRIFSRTE